MDKKEYIDAVRGWAIILVITCHVGGMFSGMPYPLKKLTNFGWHGVQLFFIASALTLLLSWHRQREVNRTTIRNFFLRRFFRIAPMYYAGIVIYYYLRPPVEGLDVMQALRSLTFVNAWHPDWLPTTGNWMVVPGGWSIGVEFTFYLVFPVLAVSCSSLSRSVIFLAGSIALSIIMEPVGSALYRDYDEAAVRDFLYFWIFNQLPVFALGFVLYFMILRNRFRIRSRTVACVLVSFIALACLALSQYPLAERFGFTFLPPTLFVASVAFAAFIFVLSCSPGTVFTHVYIRRMGVISFSSYILHFAFVHNLSAWTMGGVDLQATGYAAIGNGALLWGLTMICTVATASVAFRVIERPAMDFVHRLTAPQQGERTDQAMKPVTQA